MFPRLLRLLPAVLTFIFCLVAFVFAILAVTSPEWATRNEYSDVVKPKNWTDNYIVFTLHRSPFIVCSATENDTVINSTTGGDPTIIPHWDVACQRFRPFGFDQTSCELEIATLNSSAANSGDARLCQQIHYAGNFGIAGTTFISTGFVFAIVASLLTFVSVSRTAPEVRAGEVDDDDDQAEGHPHQHHHHHHPHPDHLHKQGRPHGSLVPYLNLALVTSLCIGAITSIIGQFYAVEGLIQSALNNGDFASTSGSPEADQHHGPWYQGKALSVYVTCAWGFAAAGAVMASRTWQLPQWEKLI